MISWHRVFIDIDLEGKKNHETKRYLDDAMIKKIIDWADGKQKWKLFLHSYDKSRIYEKLMLFIWHEENLCSALPL